MKKRFNRAVDAIIKALGSPLALVVAALVILIWAVTGPIFGFSDTWQLVINTSTTIVTFLMVFVIQNSQNRDSKAIHIKLDELIRANESARNRMTLAELETEEEQDRDIQELLAAAQEADRHSQEADRHSKDAVAAATRATNAARDKRASQDRSDVQPSTPVKTTETA